MPRSSHVRALAQNVRVTDNEVVRLEIDLLDPAHRGDRGFVERLLHPDFEEFGSSGRHWHRDEIIAAMLTDPTLPPSEPTDFRTVELGPDAILLTYRTRTALRSSIWVRTSVGWQVRFHQGTAHQGTKHPA